MNTFNIHEAKAGFSKIMRKVEQGERFTITVRGRAVADVVPSGAESKSARKQAIERLMNFPRVTGVDGDTVLEWIREGRK